MMDELRRKAKFNQNQPRVPAGSPDGGQWIDGGGGADDDRPSVAASDQDNDSSPQQVQDNPDRLLNRHIIQNHVAKTDEELKARIQARQYPGLFVRIGMDRNGSFDSTESARDFISQTIANNPGDVAGVASGELSDSFITWRFGYHTGREAIMDAPGSEIRMRPTYEVGVYIVHDPRADFGYRVVNAFPRNFNPRTGR
jgi:CDI toxin RNase A-like protein